MCSMGGAWLCLLSGWSGCLFMRLLGLMPVSVVVFVPHSEEGEDSMSRCNRYSVLMGT